ncbi:MAG: DUF3089 domain-containing protein [Endomicrobiaceae bacterium]
MQNLKRAAVLFLLLLLSHCLYAQDLNQTAGTPEVLISSVSVPQPCETQPFSVDSIPLPQEPDYSQKNSWAIMPETSDAKIDVFYVYPTIFGEEKPEYMDIYRTDLRERALNHSIFDTGIFKDSANVYVPFYRQASMQIVKLNENDCAQFCKAGFDDVIKAFDYYMQNYNKGKPFILGGFSQGSEAVLNLMKNRLSDKTLQDKLVAAYIIGYSVTDEDLAKYPFLKMAQKNDDTGVIISYNTQTPHNGYSYVLKKNSHSINPVSWKINHKKSKPKQYKGAVMFDLKKNKIVGREKPFKTACLEEGTNALVVDVDKNKYSASSATFKPGVMHSYDLMFFYNNLKDNVKTRTAAYLKKHK